MRFDESQDAPRPSRIADVYVPVDLCSATNGRLDIAPTGVVSVDAEGGNWSNAKCFTSLDGVTFAGSAASFIPLTPIDGWTSYGNGTSGPAGRGVAGVVYLKGAITTKGKNAAAFVLPAALRPANRVSVAADLCDATNGQLTIQPSGTVTVTAERAWSNAQCFTSLDGVSFARSAASFTPLTLQNGWASYGFLFAGPAAAKAGGLVRLRGAITTKGSDPVPFTLPAAFRPATSVYVKATLCNAANGRLLIAPSGVVTVQTEGAWSSAQCFTSLDGVSFAP